MATNGKLVWVDEHPQMPAPATSHQSSKNDQTKYHARRQHSKSRNGCSACRIRKIKCDESKPECGQCLHRKVYCEFLADSSETLNKLRSLGPLNNIQSSFLDPLSPLMSSVLKGLEDPCLRSTPVVYKEDARELLSHFVNDTDTKWLGAPEIQKKIQKCSLSLSINAPYVLHAMLAVAASHLSFLKPGEKKYEIAAAIHYQHALISYSYQLNAPVYSENVDAIVECSFLHVMLAFATLCKPLQHQPDQSKQWTAWLRTMQGLKVLKGLEEIELYYVNSIWKPVCVESGLPDEVECQHIRETDSSWASVTSKSLHTLCETGLENNISENPYQQPLRYLCWLMRSSASHDMIGRFIIFIGMLPSDFLDLFEKNDVRAMLIMAYWCAMFSRIDQWWIVNSARSECLRLCIILDNVSDFRVRELVSFPAQRCDFTLRS